MPHAELSQKFVRPCYGISRHCHTFKIAEQMMLWPMFLCHFLICWLCFNSEWLRLALTVMVVCPLPSPLHRYVDKAWGLLSSQSCQLLLFTPLPPTFPLHSNEVTFSTLATFGCCCCCCPNHRVVTPRHCLPSAADEEWYSPKGLPAQW